MTHKKDIIKYCPIFLWDTFGLVQVSSPKRYVREWVYNVFEVGESIDRPGENHDTRMEDRILTLGVSIEINNCILQSKLQIIFHENFTEFISKFFMSN